MQTRCSPCPVLTLTVTHFAVATLIAQIVVCNTATTTRFLLRMHCTYTAQQLRVQIKEIGVLTLMHALLDLQHPPTALLCRAALF
jgi:hypothetical protein